MAAKEATMIELTEEQRGELDQPGPARAHDPKTNEFYVLVRADVYDRLKDLLYDDSPWTDEEMDQLAAEVDAMLDDDMAIEDPSPGMSKTVCLAHASG
jgi:hypothetical protein